MTRFSEILALTGLVGRVRNSVRNTRKIVGEATPRAGWRDSQYSQNCRRSRIVRSPGRVKEVAIFAKLSVRRLPGLVLPPMSCRHRTSSLWPFSRERLERRWHHEVTTAGVITAWLARPLARAVAHDQPPT